MIDFIVHLSHGVLYPTLFVGLIVGGGIVLLPAMYLAMMGSFSLVHLFFITIAANITAETMWYGLGMSAKKDSLYRLSFIKTRIDEAKRFSGFFSTHGMMLVFVSKFIYGTRIAAQVLAGMHRIHFIRFLIATTIGSAVWFAIFYLLLKGADHSVASVAEKTKHIQFIFLVVALVLTAINIFTGTFVRKRMMK